MKHLMGYSDLGDLLLQTFDGPVKSRVLLQEIWKVVEAGERSSGI